MYIDISFIYLRYGSFAVDLQVGADVQPYFAGISSRFDICLCFWFQVGWVKADTKAIQAIHDHVITHNSRVSVSHSDHITWNLHIKNVQEEDNGLYMCQINTDPMKSQVGMILLCALCWGVVLKDVLAAK